MRVGDFDRLRLKILKRLKGQQPEAAPISKGDKESTLKEKAGRDRDKKTTPAPRRKG